MGSMGATVITLSFMLHPKCLEYFNSDLNNFSYTSLGCELDAVALKIFGICVNAASVERMWSSMGFLHTVRHNRLMRKGIEVEDPETLIEEVVARMEEEEASRENSNSNLEGDLLSEYTHPAIDKRARWELRVHL
ncbi:ribonuclease H-like domain-containing protein [Rhizophagus irregularis DAOM 181602=DAOM 197198]|uniref:HAT C-terminal dimerisation domain-containing protein n=1 Tax=Rhizophagus irregularis (strain DAOM 181602 / DAOM 197198 / MUCL 43194) TaxID=747089 RepID=A0A2P4Q741_RHIID|nr:hypothetical protein GLOIN_2v1874380 [Rhizophagus irregularis DAOM 181602=DAOM 197198]POG73408.1 hypothetical protein GLOIN_2v1874380 [Rhizophagus irregularis DAOM 181602=DAOM 197198]GET60333.1 ribonuclease H-like domain-containing protein [Rhizophagus irregularis DAOM 181602=DAOM 197198]|eukprot:XP_025180274.1 hypothetical protein GLOIN_2v1874380 [Rhizophagus irregularis DAOM 181602=DAOM 197198]